MLHRAPRTLRGFVVLRRHTFTELGAIYLGQVHSRQLGSFSFLIDKKDFCILWGGKQSPRVYLSSLRTVGREEAHRGTLLSSRLKSESNKPFGPDVPERKVVPLMRCAPQTFHGFCVLRRHAPFTEFDSRLD